MLLYFYILSFISTFKEYILLLLIFFSFFNLIIICFIPKKYIKICALGCSMFLLLLGFFLWIFFIPGLSVLQFEYLYLGFWNNFENILINKNTFFKYTFYYIGVDEFSLFLLLLTVLIFPLCILASLDFITTKIRLYYFLLLLTEFLLINCFCIQDLLLFYIFFESVLIPMYLIIIIWGSRQRKIHASYMLFFYTLGGSIFMLLAVIWIAIYFNGTQIFAFYYSPLKIEIQLILCIAFFIAFAVKLPLFPVHIWLPEAHVEAPTSGSVILAGLLLKLGGYGIIKYMIPLFPDAMIFYKPYAFTLSCIAVCFASLTMIIQTDLKKMIAYSSVCHMAYIILGTFSSNWQGIIGSYFLMIAHGLVSSALFLCVGILYDRYHTRNILYYGGLVLFMPKFSSIFFIFILANLGLPSLCNFIGELLILIGLIKLNSTALIIASLGMITNGIFGVWLYNRLNFGFVKMEYIKKYRDITLKEFFTLFPLLFFTLVLGVYPNIILNYF